MIAALAGGIIGVVVTRALEEPPSRRAAPASPSPPPEEVLKVGETATTLRGNDVTVEDFVPSVRLANTPKGQIFSEAAVKYCVGGSEVTVAVGVVSRLFSVRLDNGSEATVAPGVPGEDLLDESQSIIGRGRCVKGNLFFLRPEDAKPNSVVYKGYSTVTWELAA